MTARDQMAEKAAADKWQKSRAAVATKKTEEELARTKGQLAEEQARRADLEAQHDEASANARDLEAERDRLSAELDLLNKHKQVRLVSG